MMRPAPPEKRHAWLEEEAHMERLDKIIASTGRWSRREVKDLIRQGRVLVDGYPAAAPEEKADPETARITVNGETLEYRRYTWVMLNKPAGYLSATEDGRGPTVLDLLPPELQRRGLFPVGRLDKDTEGLLLLTNEGRLAHDLLSPRRHVDKVYRARVTGCLTAEDAAAFAAGLVLGDGTIDREIADQSLDKMEIDKLGLDSNDIRILKTIIRNYGGGPVGVETLAAAVGEETVTIEDVCEPYLMQIGFLVRTPRGRCVTPLAYDHLGLARPMEMESGQLRLDEFKL